MAGSGAALRVGLLGGVVLGLAIVAQQVTEAPELRLAGFAIILTGLCITGYLGARDSGNFQLAPSARAGAVAGLIAGLLASLAAIAVLLFLSVNGETLLRINEALNQVYNADQLKQLDEMGVTMETLAQSTIIIQIVCCGAALPLAGLTLGALGGAFVPGVYRNRRRDGEA